MEKLRAWFRAKKRLAMIGLALPEAIDLWVLIMQAGLDFQVALKYYVQHGVAGPLRDEMQLLQREIQLGTPRIEALRRLAQRVPEPHLQETVRTVLQGIRLGASLTPLLRNQARALRQKIAFRAEKRAAQAPIKLMFPLFVFIFPTILIILVAPILLTVRQGGLP